MSKQEIFYETLEALADRLVAGEVVFFIGAGYSIDSEKNTAKILIARLLARFEALTAELQNRLDSPDAVRKLRTGLLQTFGLKTDDSDSESVFGSYLDHNLGTLQVNYYAINDWMCSAFETLIELLSRVRLTESLLRKINERENKLLVTYHDIDPLKNKHLLQPSTYRDYIKFQRYVKKKAGGKAEGAVAGKALFLDTMGFADKKVMGGKPMAPKLDAVVKSYGTRLRPRHWVLAWLALEGLCPTLITTNYDLLLEGAYRLAGMLPRNPPQSIWPEDEEAPLDKARKACLPVDHRFLYFTRIADATQFFSYGDGYHAAIITKIHGCVDSYRIARDPADEKDSKKPKTWFQEWRRIIPTMVFTYREIQNWRGDSWSRDYLRTLLRTRTVVFAGYSGADPVIHDTFRTVYEEVAAYRRREDRKGPLPQQRRSASATAMSEKDGLSRKASAFFLNLDEKKEFHGLEILRAASMAVGEPNPALTDHLNLLPFHYSQESKFPHLDELMAWIFHLTYRKLQLQALQNELARIAYQLLGHPGAKREIRQITDNFKQILTAEKQAATGFQSDASEKNRNQFQRITGWTLYFHTSLMREFTLGESQVRKPESWFRIQKMARYPWYISLNDHPQWAAWAAVLELAIRHRAATWRGWPDDWMTVSHRLEPINAQHPIVLFDDGSRDAPAADGIGRPRRCIGIRLITLGKALQRTQWPRSLQLARPVVWSIRSQAVPWWLQSDDARPSDTPSPQTLWNWAAGTVSPLGNRTESNVYDYFGGINAT